MTKRLGLLTEFLLLFAGGPLLILLCRSAPLMIGLMWGSALLVYLVMRHGGYRLSADWNGKAVRAKGGIVFAHFAVAAPLLALLTWEISQHTFLQLPLHNPRFWLVIMALYPLLSVWPQEIIYRAFLNKRYAPLFGKGAGFVLASAAAFAFMHIIFLNFIAVALTFCGGLMMARTYTSSRSLALTCVEHALYGCFVFTIGLGHFFYHGAAWR